MVNLSSPYDINLIITSFERGEKATLTGIKWCRGVMVKHADSPQGLSVRFLHVSLLNAVGEEGNGKPPS